MGKRTLLCGTIGILVVLAGEVTLSQSATPGTAPQPTTTAPDFAEEPNWQAVCAEAMASPLPTAAAALALSASTEITPADGECNEPALYYGFGKMPDYGAALRCAYWHRAHPATGTVGFLDGAGTLAMLYANGNGVPRNYTLAIRFACELKDRGGQNTEERIGRLETLRDNKPTADTTFDLCDEQMSGTMGAYCSGLAEEEADVARARSIEAAKKRLPERARVMLPKLQEAERAFEEARIRGEYTGGGGSGSVGFATDDRNRLREQFVINLERFEAGTLPRATASEREQAEHQLEAAYGAAQALPLDPNAYAGSPTHEGLKATEDAWSALFREWMQFVPVAYPELSRDAAAVELLRLRIHQLKKLVR